MLTFRKVLCASVFDVIQSVYSIRHGNSGGKKNFNFVNNSHVFSLQLIQNFGLVFSYFFLSLSLHFFFLSLLIHSFISISLIIFPHFISIRHYCRINNSMLFNGWARALNWLMYFWGKTLSLKHEKFPYEIIFYLHYT